MRKFKQRRNLWNSPAQRRRIIDKLTLKYGFRCWYCGFRFKGYSDVCIDHKDALAYGGKNEIENFALSCKYCNSHKLYFSVEAFLKYLAYLRTGFFECPILEEYKDKVDPATKDILQKSFY